MMDIDALKNALKAEGWNFGSPISETGVSWYAWRKLAGATDCACNDKPPSLCLTPYRIEAGGRVFSSVEFELTAEVKSGRWMKLQAYSVPVAEAVASIPECEALLRAAWEAAANVEVCRPVSGM